MKPRKGLQFRTRIFGEFVGYVAIHLHSLKEYRYGRLAI